MGEDYVRGMCHDIEDPTFDATALATNRKAQVRPIHRPPRTPADRHPHCAWTVIIDESYPEVAVHPGDGRRRAEPRAPTPNSTRSIPNDEGRPTIRARCCRTSTSVRSRIRRWCGSPTRSACRCTCWTCRSARGAASARAPTTRRCERSICTKQLIGIAGVAAERIHQRARASRRSRGRAARARTASDAQPGGIRDGRRSARTSCTCDRSPAHEDGAWISLVSPVREPAAAGDRRSRRPAPRRGGDRNRVPTGPCACHRNRHRGKGIAARSRCARFSGGVDVGVRGAEVAFAADGRIAAPTHRRR